MAKTTYVIRISAKKICMWIRKKDELQASFAYTALEFPKGNKSYSIGLSIELTQILANF